LNRDALVKQVYDYTKSVLVRFEKEGLPLSIVSIGNEITAGLLWPIGKLSNSDGPKNVAMLLKSASKAVRENGGSGRPKVMVHLDNGFYWGTQVRSPLIFVPRGGGSRGRVAGELFY
jgi:arabinogalactan endo-1,4-beta-galactosidase